MSVHHVGVLYCIETAKPTIKRFSLPGSTIILVFPQETQLRNSDGTPQRGRQIEVGYQKVAIIKQYIILSRKRLPSYCERQADSRWPRHHAAVVKQPHAVRNACSPRPRHASHVSARHLSSMPLSSRGLSTPRRHGLVCVQPLITRVSTRCCVAASGSATATTTCRSSPTVFSTADYEFFRRVTSNSTHVLHPYLPDETHIPYQLRTGSQSHRLYHSAAVQTFVLVTALYNVFFCFYCYNAFCHCFY